MKTARQKVCSSTLFSHVHSYEHRGEGAEYVSTAAFDSGKNFVFINLYPAVGLHLGIYSAHHYGIQAH